MADNFVKIVSKDEVVFSFPHVVFPHSVLGGPMKYSVNVLFREDSDFYHELLDAIHAVYNKAMLRPGQVKKEMSDLKLPIRRGDFFRADDPMYQGMMYIEATSMYKPGVIDSTGKHITDASEFRGGDIGRVSVTVEPYMKNGDCAGIACRINNIMKTKNGNVSSTSTAEDDFCITSIPF